VQVDRLKDVGEGMYSARRVVRRNPATDLPQVKRKCESPLQVLAKIPTPEQLPVSHKGILPYRTDKLPGVTCVSESSTPSLREDEPDRAERASRPATKERTFGASVSLEWRPPAEGQGSFSKSATTLHRRVIRLNCPEACVNHRQAAWNHGMS
jgi:hypothetical protein